MTPIRVLNLGKAGNWNPFSTMSTSTFGSAELDARSLHKITLYPSCRSRKSHPRGFAPEGESGQHPKRCLPSSICLRCSSPICSNRGGSWKSRTSFFVTSSTSPSGVHRAVCGCVGATGRCWCACPGFGQACSGRRGSFSLTRYCGGIEQGFAPIGAGNPALGRDGHRSAVSCANSSVG